MPDLRSSSTPSRSPWVLWLSLVLSGCAVGGGADRPSDEGSPATAHDAAAHDARSEGPSDAATGPGEGERDDASAMPRDAQAPVGEGDAAQQPQDAGTPDAEPPVSDAGPSPDCVPLDESLRDVAVSATAGEHGLFLRAQALSATRWAAQGNEAMVLEVHAEGRFVGHLLLHQGAAPFEYTMHVGELAAQSSVQVRLSPLSQASGAQGACVLGARLASAAELGAEAEGLAHAPVFLWPLQKRFDDVPLVVGWSRSLRRYEVVYSNENGGTTHSCGGNSQGIQALVARWGRAADVERAYEPGSPARWQRCTGRTDTSDHALRYEGAHPLLYYGDGHNRLYESRGGYGQACGSGGAERSDGNLTGWNSANPGNDASLDAAYVVRLRPLPVSLDDLPEYTSSPDGRREALIDRHAPWLYRLTFAELAREGKIDGARTFDMERYVFADVQAYDVGGQGDSYCSTLGLKGGFKVRLISESGALLQGPQITSDFFPGPLGWKRVAFALDRAYEPGEIRAVQLDAFDNDGVYFVALGDLFMLRPEGDNGARLSPLHEGVESVNVYSDDDSSGCSNGVNPDGPAGGPMGGYPCVGTSYDVPL